jgi:hypothetical protein
MRCATAQADRVTLTPNVPAALRADATVFHRALEAWNAGHYRAATFDDLTVDEQRAVYDLAAVMEKEAHPCRK